MPRSHSRSRKWLAPLAVAAGAAALTAAAPLAAHADSGNSYSATLNALNGSGGSGSVWISVTGDQAKITEHWSGLASTFMGGPYPHVQHIHIGAAGTCPTMADDKNNDGVISTTEGASDYGAIGTTLSVKGDTSPAAGTDVKIAPGGSSTDYSRTITLDSKTMQSLRDDTAVVVVHGLDPSTLSKKAQNEKSDLVPSLPLAATSPALCGALHAMPASGPDTGTGSTAGIEDEGIIGGGAALLLTAGAAAMFMRRTGRQN